MKQSNCYLWILFTNLITMLIIIFMHSGVEKVGMEAKQKMAEYGYAQGQADAMRGEIHIKKIEDHYKWIDSPWDDGRETIIDLKEEEL